MTDLRFDSPPGVLPSYLRAVVRARGADLGRPLPARRAILSDVRADPARLARYAEVCGVRQDGTMPPAYPHLLAFPASLALMTAADFPLPLLGLVHTANTVTVRRPIGARERLAMEVSTDRRRPHPRGTVFDVAAVAGAGGEEVWSSRSTYLYRHATEANVDRPSEQSVPEVEFESWWLPAASGRRYAAVSGDRNPIHLHPWTARPFGFRRAIAHGMWTKARVLAALGERVPAAADIEVSFRAPVELPSGARLSVRDLAGRTDFALTAGDGVRTYLQGSVTAR